MNVELKFSEWWTMAHLQQKAFCSSVKEKHPQFFQGVFALDIGSLDINGNNQYLFDAGSLYLGIDVAEGRNVDLVCPAHELGLPQSTFDVIVSTECLEHDRYWDKTLCNAVRMLRPGGMLLITCATEGRQEHGTRRTTPQDAPLLAAVDSEWADYYRNLTEVDFRTALNIDEMFSYTEFSTNAETHDLYFFGIKRGDLGTGAKRSFNLPSHPARLLQADLRLQLQRANEELDRIYASRSWRITRPLRTPMSVIHRVAQIALRIRNALRYVIRGDAL